MRLRNVRPSLSWATAVLVLVCSTASCAPGPGASPGCPEGMARIERAGGPPAYCIDRWEASLVDESGRDFSPYEAVSGRPVRAVSRAGVVPQAYLSRDEAAAACKRSEKRLCTEAEWTMACSGGTGATFPYGSAVRPGVCNDHGKSPLLRLAAVLAGDEWQRMNDPRLNQQSSTVAKTGSHASCKSPFGVFDMVGNVHEWVDDPEGTFLGGYYLDTKLNGPGCRYKTVAHGASYHDYSTGFRCCAAAR